MKPLIIPVISLFILISFIFPFDCVYARDESVSTDRAKKILREFDDLWRGSSSHSLLRMKVKTAHYERNMKLEMWSKGKEKTLVRIISPLKEKGTATLKSGNNIYSYLPKTDRTIRLTSGMMMGSWMGSHFTNDDFVKESRMEDDYSPTITFEGMRDNRELIEFTLIPKPDAPVVWGKVVLTLISDGFIPVMEYYYDEEMNIAREMIFSDVKELAGRPRPSVMKIIPSDKPEEYTELVYEIMELDIPLNDDFFSIANLKRLR